MFSVRNITIQNTSSSTSSIATVSTTSSKRLRSPSRKSYFQLPSSLLRVFASPLLWMFLQISSRRIAAVVSGYSSSTSSITKLSSSSSFFSSNALPFSKFLEPHRRRNDIPVLLRTTGTNAITRCFSTFQPSMAPLQDASAISRARAPFRMPKDSYDDSMPTAVHIKGGGGIHWSKLGLMEEFVMAVYEVEHGMGLQAPTPVQSTVIPALLNMGPSQSVAFAAATGSGKTLAYLLPIMQQLKIQEMDLITTTTNSNNASATATVKLMEERRPKRPRVLVLAPTRELAQQISSVIKSLSHTIKLSSAVVVGGEDYGTQKKKLDKYLDIVVATPGRLVKHRNDGNIFLGSVQYVVVDEMDTMLEQGFQADIGNLVHPLLYTKDRNGKALLQGGLREGAPRVVLTSATMTNAVKRLLKVPGVPPKRRLQQKGGPQDDDSVQTMQLPSNIRVIELPGLHRVVPRLRQVFVDVGNVDKLSLLLDVVLSGGGKGSAISTKERKNSGSSTRPLTMVFCNTVASCRAAEHALAEAGINSLCYHGEMNSMERSENLKLFRESGEGLDDTLPNVLVCTDIAARGLDVPQVDHVVMFDFPLNPIDYLHRAGRTARGLGSGTTTSHGNHDSLRPGSGRVTALVAKRDRVLAAAIESAVQRGEPLDNLSSRKSDYLPGGRLGLGGSKKKPLISDTVKKTKIISQIATATMSGRRGRGGRSDISTSTKSSASSFRVTRNSSSQLISGRHGKRLGGSTGSGVNRKSGTSPSSQKASSTSDFVNRSMPNMSKRKTGGGKSVSARRGLSPSGARRRSSSRR